PTEESMHLVKSCLGLAAAVGCAILAVACSDTKPTGPGPSGDRSCAGVSFATPPASATTMNVSGLGVDTMRYTAEVAVRGTLAYTSTWNVRRLQGNKVTIWDLSEACPTLVDSVIVTGAVTTGDVEISDDGSLLAVATEYGPGSVAIYDLSNP